LAEIIALVVIFVGVATFLVALLGVSVYQRLKSAQGEITALTGECAELREENRQLRGQIDFLNRLTSRNG